jgi:hypothetical protein
MTFVDHPVDARPGCQTSSDIGRAQTCQTGTAGLPTPRHSHRSVAAQHVPLVPRGPGPDAGLWRGCSKQACHLLLQQRQITDHREIADHGVLDQPLLQRSAGLNAGDDPAMPSPPASSACICGSKYLLSTGRAVADGNSASNTRCRKFRRTAARHVPSCHDRAMTQESGHSALGMTHRAAAPMTIE